MPEETDGATRSPPRTSDRIASPRPLRCRRFKEMRFSIRPLSLRNISRRADADSSDPCGFKTRPSAMVSTIRPVEGLYAKFVGNLAESGRPIFAVIRKTVHLASQEQKRACGRSCRSRMKARQSGIATMARNDWPSARTPDGPASTQFFKNGFHS